MPIANVNAFPSKQAGINRPGAWSEQRQAYAKGSQEDVRPKVPRLREDFPDAEQCSRHSSLRHSSLRLGQ